MGNRGKGESIWLGFFLYNVLKDFLSIVQEREEKELANLYQNILMKLKKALNEAGWDENWYKRAYTDEGDVLGSIHNEECKIDSISQSWSVISEAGENGKMHKAISSLEKYLIHPEEGIIQLLDPPFEKSKLEPGYIKSYLPGVRENGGQYTHAAIWAVMAFAKLGLKEKAVRYFKMINPIEHGATKEKEDIYKLEPYVMSADIYGSQNLAGRGGWSWYTGSASWYYRCGIEYLLGMQIKNNTIEFHPCIPDEWKEYTIQYRFGNSIYNIKIHNQNKTNKVQKIKINGEWQDDKCIKLLDYPQIFNIEIII